MVVEIDLSKTSKARKHRGKYKAIVDDIDEDLAKEDWSASPNRRVRCYAIRHFKQVPIMLHRVIMERIIAPYTLESYELVDHINGNGLDNRRENLRLVTHQQNMMNKKTPITNKSGQKGVRWEEDRGKWRASITIKGKGYFIGRFTTFEDACKAREEKEIELFGEYRNKR